MRSRAAIAIALFAFTATPQGGDPGYQLVLLRRTDQVILGSATVLPKYFDATAPGDARIIVMYRDSTWRIGRGRLRPDGLIMLVDTIIPGKPGTVSYQIGVEHGMLTYRAPREDFFPPPALRTLTALGVSPPVLLQPPSADVALPLQPDSALQLMTPYHVIKKGAPLGVYWETYGIAPRDSVDILLTVTAGSKRTPTITHAWSDATPSTGSKLLPGSDVPVISRSVLLDGGQLPAGTYRIDVSVTPREGQTVRSTTMVTVQNR